ncbi:crosslink repair DNA glycosylase YcaQ family protein [Paenibacillus sp. FSL H8-0122]|uniref:DNA glycosylase AlkZ-like family protein n=1 Tax=Paenibacillus sp. FSL H8-0122 TaxID=2954510 RepID=UPI0030F8F1A8
MEIIEISKEELKSFLVTYQGLHPNKPKADRSEIIQFIKRVGCIQYDPLNMVGHNPDLMLQSRFYNYDPSILNRLLYETRDVIDGWDKMMAIYLTEDWPYFRRMRVKKREEIEGILTYRNSSSALQYVEEVKEHIVNKGPISPAFIDFGRAEKGRWGHGKLSSATMDYMWNVGILSVKEKKNTQKIYDLTENLLPSHVLEQKDPFVDDYSFYKWYFKRRIGSLGAYWLRNGGGWLGHFVSDKKLRIHVLNELFEDGELVQLKIKGSKEIFYMRSEDKEVLNQMSMEIPVSKALFLAPLDNLLWDRKLIKDIFDFEYSWEVYKPVSSRKYGYYVLPVLVGNQLVARFEPEKHRANEPLNVKNWWWEDGITITGQLIDAVFEGINDFCSYLKADGLSPKSTERITTSRLKGIDGKNTDNNVNYVAKG